MARGRHLGYEHAVSPILAEIAKYLDQEFDADGIESPDEDGAIVFRYADEDERSWGCMAIADEDCEQLMFYSVWPEPVPEPRRAAVMEFVTRANYGLPVGNFELDLEDGEVRMKTSLDLEGVELSGSLCGNLVDTNLAAMGRYLEGLLAVVAGEATPAEAIDAVEDDEDDDDDDDD